MNHPHTASILIALGLAASTAGAQVITNQQPEASPPEPAPRAEPALPEQDAASEWTFSLTPYLWVPAMDGTISVRGNSIDVDVSSSDALEALVDNFNGALVLHAEATKNKLSLIGDVMYFSMENDLQHPVHGSTNIEYSQAILELGAGYAVVDEPAGTDDKGHFRLEPIAGLRIQWLDQEVNGSAGLSVSGDKAWVDGFVGARAALRLTERFTLVGRADIGGGGSNLTWNLLGAVDFRMAHWASLELGYRALSTDYDDGSGADYFQYDTVLHGPFLAFTFRF